MRLGRLALCLVFPAAVGCLPLRDASTRDLLDRYNPFTAPAGQPNKVVLRTVLLDQPAGDPYLAKGLWAAAQKPLPAAAAALLAENGFRVGTFTGNAPPEFLALLTDEAAVRPTESTVPAGEAKPLPVNGPLPSAAFGVADEIGAAPRPFDLAVAECGLSVTATPADGDKLKLAFEPRVQHGERQGWLRPSADGTGLAWLDGKAQERFPKAAFDVTVNPGEFVVVGPSESPAGKLGGAFFFSFAEGRGRMRVLVIRAWRPTEAPVTAGKAAVAAQASRPVGR